MKRIGKQVKQLQEFIFRIKSGETGIIHGTDYVVMDTKTYNALKKEILEFLEEKI